MIELPVRNSDEVYIVKPRKIVALGLNYSDHVKESLSVLASGKKPEDPSEPVIFPKATSSIIGHNENIVIPAFIEGYKFEEPRTDYEAELAFFISKDCRNVSPEEAMDYIYGFTCLNDVSQRNLQNGDKSGWFRCKSLDTFCPIGPVLVKTSEVGDPQKLNIECRLNGTVVQSSNTESMIFPIKSIISILSSWFTLEEGDLITTGTPSGVGPIKNGDVVEVEIENIGVLRNPVVKE